MRLDHLTHWVGDLDAAIVAYERLGFSIERGGDHPGYGTHNAMWIAGDAFVELLAVREPGEAARGWAPVWTQVEDLLARGGGTFKFRVGVPELPAYVRELAARGVKTRELTGTTRYADGTRPWTHALLPGSPAWAPVFVEQRPAGEGMRSAWRIAGLGVETPDPTAACAWLANILARPCTQDADGTGVSLDDVRVTFTAGAADSVTSVLVDGADAPRGEVANLRFEPVPARRGGGAA
jgi:catechol 2,3-dioxygenase-like lactoylglutathione lyase family enzyme